MIKLPALLVAVLVIVLAAMIVLNNRSGGGTLFLEVWRDVSGKVLEGEPRKLMIDFPTYKFDEETGELSGITNFDINRSHLLVVGLGESLSGDAGGGVSSHLVAIDDLPCDIEGIRITAISNGKITLEYMGQEISLAPGEKWTNTSKSIQSFGETRMKIIETITITNHGYVKLKPRG